MKQQCFSSYMAFLFENHSNRPQNPLFLKKNAIYVQNSPSFTNNIRYAFSKHTTTLHKKYHL